MRTPLVVVAFLTLFVGSANAQTQGCERLSLPFNYTCQVTHPQTGKLICQQTLSNLRRCQNLTVSGYKCHPCFFQPNCCGSPVCDARQFGFCEGGEDPLALPIILQDLREGEPGDTAQFYVATCSGDFVPFSDLAGAFSKPSGDPSSSASNRRE